MFTMVLWIQQLPFWKATNTFATIGQRVSSSFLAMWACLEWKESFVLAHVYPCNWVPAANKSSSIAFMSPRDRSSKQTFLPTWPQNTWKWDSVMQYFPRGSGKGCLETRWHCGFEFWWQLVRKNLRVAFLSTRTATPMLFMSAGNIRGKSRAARASYDSSGAFTFGFWDFKRRQTDRALHNLAIFFMFRPYHQRENRSCWIILCVFLV